MSSKKFVTLLAVLLMTGSFAAVANHSHSHEQNAPAANVPGLAQGEIKKVDKSAGKVTIKHGPLVNLDMPAMTMVFRVNDPTVLDTLRKGDQVKFEAAKINGAYTVVHIEQMN